MSDLVDTITQWLKKSTGASSGQDRLEWAAEFNKVHRRKDARKLATLVEQFKKMGPGAKREILTHLSASNVDAYGMLATLGR